MDGSAACTDNIKSATSLFAQSWRPIILGTRGGSHFQASRHSAFLTGRVGACLLEDPLRRGRLGCLQMQENALGRTSLRNRPLNKSLDPQRKLSANTLSLENALHTAFEASTQIATWMLHMWDLAQEGGDVYLWCSLEQSCHAVKPLCFCHRCKNASGLESLSLPAVAAVAQTAAIWAQPSIQLGHLVHLLPVPGRIDWEMDQSY